MKKFSFISTTFVALVLLTGCGEPTEVSISTERGSVEDLYSDVLAYAQSNHPEAVLIGYNNSGPSFDRVNYVPTERDLSGETNYWTYIFSESPALLEDGVINSEDAFAVEFFNGNLTYAGYVETRNQTYDADSISGQALLSPDSTEIVERFLATAKEELGVELEPYHIHFNATAGGYELTVFTSDTEGASGFFSFREGEFSAIQPFSISNL